MSSTFPFQEYGPSVSTPWYPPIEMMAHSGHGEYLVPNNTNNNDTVTNPTSMNPQMSGSYAATMWTEATSLFSEGTQNPTRLSSSSSYNTSFPQAFPNSCYAMEVCEEEEQQRAQHEAMLRDNRASNACYGEAEGGEGEESEKTTPFLQGNNAPVSAVALCTEIANYLQRHPHRWQDPTTVALLRHAMSQLPKDIPSTQLAQLLSASPVAPLSAPLALTWHGTGEECFGTTGKRQREEIHEAETERRGTAAAAARIVFMPDTIESNAVSRSPASVTSPGAVCHCGGRLSGNGDGCCRCGHFLSGETAGAGWRVATPCGTLPSSGLMNTEEGDEGNSVDEVYWKRLRVDEDVECRRGAGHPRPSPVSVSAQQMMMMGVEEEGGAGTPANNNTSRDKTFGVGVTPNPCQNVAEEEDSETDQPFGYGRKRARGQPIVEFVSLGRRLE